MKIKLAVLTGVILGVIFIVVTILGLGCGKISPSTTTTTTSSTTTTTFFAGSWEAQSAAGPSNIGFLGVHFLDHYLGLIAATNQFIYSTTDGGATWHSRELVTSESFNLGSAFIAGTPDIPDGFVVGEGGRIYFSATDLATGWVSQESGTSQKLNSVYFVSSREGYFAGHNGTIGNTNNAGASWSSVSFSSDNLRAIGFAHQDNNYGFAVGDSGKVRSTQDGGVNWVGHTVPGVTGSLRAVFVCDPQVSYAAGEGGVIIKSVNGGQSWSVLTSGTANHLRGIAFVSTVEGWAVGDSGTILYTINGGTTWASQESGTSKMLYGVSFVDENNGWAVGEKKTVLKFSR